MADTAALRAMVGPEPRYPTPWRHERTVVVSAHEITVAHCDSPEVAEVIAAAVNEFTTRAAVDPREVEKVLTAAFWGKDCTGNALHQARIAVSALLRGGYTVVGPSREVSQ